MFDIERHGAFALMAKRIIRIANKTQRYPRLLITVRNLNIRERRGTHRRAQQQQRRYQPISDAIHHPATFQRLTG
ncbi:hypothetical protein L341_0435 [Escherichia coli CE418]|nr:hypothetical protein L341_0435 [Escherichia coli CE418]